MRFYVTHSLVILAGSLQGRVNAPVTEVKKKRPVFIRLDNVDGLIRPIVREIEDVVGAPRRNCGGDR